MTRAYPSVNLEIIKIIPSFSIIAKLPESKNKKMLKNIQ